MERKSYFFKNNHGADCCGTVGKEKGADIETVDSQSDRIYFIRYTPPNGKTYVELLGINYQEKGTKIGEMR